MPVVCSERRPANDGPGFKGKNCVSHQLQCVLHLTCVLCQNTFSSSLFAPVIFTLEESCLGFNAKVLHSFDGVALGRYC